MAHQSLQVGAPDPELDTSPIVGDDEEAEVEPNVPGGGCMFNGQSYRVGAIVLSGTSGRIALTFSLFTPSPTVPLATTTLLSNASSSVTASRSSWRKV